MSSLLVSLFLGVGVGAWVFAKISHNHMSSRDGLIAGGIAGGIAFLVMWLTMSTFLS